MTSRDDIIVLKRIISNLTEAERALLKEWLVSDEELQRYKPVERGGPVRSGPPDER
jgi:hypothetical protein